MDHGHCFLNVKIRVSLCDRWDFTDFFVPAAKVDGVCSGGWEVDTNFLGYGIVGTCFFRWSLGKIEIEIGKGRNFLLRMGIRMACVYPVGCEKESLITAFGYAGALGSVGLVPISNIQQQVVLALR